MFYRHRLAPRHQDSLDQGRQVCHANSDRALHGASGHVERGIAISSHRHQAVARLDPQGRASRTLESHSVNVVLSGEASFHSALGDGDALDSNQVDAVVGSSPTFRSNSSYEHGWVFACHSSLVGSKRD